VETLRTWVYNYLNHLKAKNGKTLKPSNPILSKNTVRPSKNDSIGGW
jgi:hypothetical protein